MIGSRFGDWEVIGLGGSDRLSFLVMTVKIQAHPRARAPTDEFATAAAGLKKVTESRAEYNRC